MNFADRRRQQAPELKAGDLVWLNAKYITTKRPSKKLDQKRLGPYPVDKVISSHAYRLKLPQSLRFIHPVFHVSLLEPCRQNTIQNRTHPPPLPVEVDGQTEYEVSAILDARRSRGKLQYYVQWKGYDGHAESATWEPSENVSNATALVNAFHRKYPTKPGP